MSETTGLTNRSLLFFCSSRRRHTRWYCDWSSDVCSSDLGSGGTPHPAFLHVWRVVLVAGRARASARGRPDAGQEPRPLLDRKSLATASASFLSTTTCRSEERRVGKECRSAGTVNSEIKIN